MSFAEQLFQNQRSESEQAIEEYYKNNKEKLLKFPNMLPTFDPENKTVYCVYRPRSIDDLLPIMESLPKKAVDIIINQYGFGEHRSYVYQRLGIRPSNKKTKKPPKIVKSSKTATRSKAAKPSKTPKNAKSTKTTRTNKQKEPRISNLSELVKFFSFAFDTDANVFVHLLNKETGETYFYPTDSLKDQTKLSEILNSECFVRNVDLMYSLATFNTMKGATAENVFFIPLIQVDVDYRKISMYKDKTPQQVWQLILGNEVGKTIPHPSAIEYGHQLRLLFKIKDLYVKKGSEASKNIARRISRVFAQQLFKYGAEGQPITSHGRIPGSINSKDGSTVGIELFGHKYEIEEIKEKWLEPLPEWYSEWKSTQKKKRKAMYLQNNLTLNTKRLRDFFRIVDYFHGDIDGRRFLCFMVRQHALLAEYSTVEARDMMLDLNSRFKFPLRERIIEQDTRNVERKQYFFKNETILEQLCITPDIEVNLRLETIISSTEKKRRDKVKKARRYRAKKYGDPGTSKRSIIEAEKKKIMNLLAEGHKKKNICKMLGIQPKTLQRRIKELRNEGLL